MSIRNNRCKYNLRKRKRIEIPKEVQNPLQNKKKRVEEFLNPESVDIKSVDPKVEDPESEESVDLELSDPESEDIEDPESEDIEDLETVDIEISTEEESSEEDDGFIVYDEDCLFPNNSSSTFHSLVKSISSRLLSNIPKEELDKIVKSVLNKEYEFCDESENWNSVGLDSEDEKIKKLKPVLKEIRKSLSEDKITLSKILESRTSFLDKKKAIELYDILENTETCTLEYKNVENMIKNIIKNTFESEEIEKEASEIEKEIVSKTENYIYGLKRKILFLNTDNDTKARIYDIYNRMIDLDP